jgi:hypothetical protein
LIASHTSLSARSEALPMHSYTLIIPQHTARTSGPPSHLLVHMRSSCGNRHGAITTTASLDVVAVHAGCSAVVVNTHVALLLSVVVDIFEIEGVDVTREDAGNIVSTLDQE